MPPQRRGEVRPQPDTLFRDPVLVISEYINYQARQANRRTRKSNRLPDESFSPTIAATFAVLLVILSCHCRSPSQESNQRGAIPTSAYPAVKGILDCWNNLNFASTPKVC